MANSWQFWALMSAVFAAMTALFAKFGVQSVNPDYATFIRTLVIVFVLAAILLATGQFQSLRTVSHKGLLFLFLSGLATGGSWICYFRALKLGDASRVAPIDKLSVLFIAILAAVFLGERLPVTGWIGILLIGTGSFLLMAK